MSRLGSRPALLAELAQLLPWNCGQEGGSNEAETLARWRWLPSAPTGQRIPAQGATLGAGLRNEERSEGTPHNTGVGWRGSKLHGGRAPQRQAQRNAAGRQRGHGEDQPGESGPGGVLLLAPPSPRTTKGQQ